MLLALPIKSETDRLQKVSVEILRPSGLQQPYKSIVAATIMKLIVAASSRGIQNGQYMNKPAHKAESQI